MVAEQLQRVDEQVVVIHHIVDFLAVAVNAMDRFELVDDLVEVGIILQDDARNRLLGAGGKSENIEQDRALAVPLEQPMDAGTVDHLHGHEVAVSVFAELDDLADVAVVEQRNQARFVQEELEQLAVDGERGQHPLEGHHPLIPRRPHLRGQAHLAHAARRQATEDSVLPRDNGLGHLHASREGEPSRGEVGRQQGGRALHCESPSWH